MDARIREEKVYAIRSANIQYLLADGQCFYKTPKAWEIWNEKPLRRVKRIDARMIFWIREKK